MADKDPTPQKPDVKAVGDKPEVEERLHPILSNEEVRAAQAQARKEIVEEQKKQAKASLVQAEKRKLQRTEGLTTGHTVEDEIVNITIDLPLFCSHLRTNDTPYWHGHTYSVPRHIARDLAWRMQSEWSHDALERLGESRSEMYQGRRETVVSPAGIKNAPQRAI